MSKKYARVQFSLILSTNGIDCSVCDCHVDQCGLFREFNNEKLGFISFFKEWLKFSWFLIEKLSCASIELLKNI